MRIQVLKTFSNWKKECNNSDSRVSSFRIGNKIMNFNKKPSFNFRLKKKKKIKTNTTTEVPANFKTYDPDRKKYACAYCGDKFPQKLVRAQHEKAEHVNSEGTV